MWRQRPIKRRPSHRKLRSECAKNEILVYIAQVGKWYASISKRYKSLYIIFVENNQFNIKRKDISHFFAKIIQHKFSFYLKPKENGQINWWMIPGRVQDMLLWICFNLNKEIAFLSIFNAIFYPFSISNKAASWTLLSFSHFNLYPSPSEEPILFLEVSTIY